MRAHLLSVRAAAYAQSYWLLSETSAIAVDTGPAGCARRLLEVLATTNVGNGTVRLILVTHGHLDHFGSAAALHALTGAPIAVHAADAEALRQGRNDPAVLVPHGLVSRIVRSLPLNLGGAPVPGITPQRTFTEAWRLDEFGIPGEVVPTPGHTPGSVSVVLDDGRALIGDLLMGGMLSPQRPTWPFFVWDASALRASVARLIELGVRTFYPVHGGPFEAPAVQKWLAQAQG